MVSFIISILIQLVVLNGGTTNTSSKEKGAETTTTTTSDETMQTFGGVGNWTNPGVAETTEDPNN